MSSQTVLFNLRIEDANAATRLQILRENLREIQKEMKGVDERSVAFKHLFQEASTTRLEITRLTAEQKKLNREIKSTSFAADSLGGMRLAYSKLTEEVTKLTRAQRESDGGKVLIGKAAALKSEIDKVEQSVGRFTGQVGDYKKALLSIGDIVTGGLITGGIVAAFTALERLGERVISVNAKVSDKIADVARAAQISVEVVNKLADKLETRDTRTSLLDQLDIAKIGAKLGVVDDQLFDFVASVDKVNIALGDEFGGSVEKTTDVLGKLRNVLADTKTNDIAQDISQLGNALSFLEAQGVASAAGIAEFSTRIGGVGSTLGVTSGQILGVSTTLAELGVNAERGSSGFIRLMQRVSQSPAEFAKAAGANTKEFTELVNKDLFGAVQLFLTKINDKNLSNTQLQSTLKALKVNGVGTAEVVSKLGDNLGLLSTRVDQAGKSLEETGTITQAFEKKNTTLGAEIEKLKNGFDNFFTNSGISSGLGLLVRGFGDLGAGIVGVISALAQLPRFVDENKVALLGLVAGLELMNGQMIFAALNSLRLAVVERGRVAVTYLATTAQNLLNVAMRANPIGLIITAVSALALGFTYLYDKSQAFRALLAGIAETAKVIYNSIKDTFSALFSDDPSQAFKKGKDLGEAFRKGYNDKIQSENDKAQDDARARLEGERDDRQLASLKKKKEANLDTDAAIDKSAESKAKKRAKEADDQLKRINDLRSEIRKLDAETIVNDFDRKEIEITAAKLTELAKLEEKRLALVQKIKGQKGGATAADNTEAGLISEEKASIIAAYDEQFKAVAVARQKAQDEQLARLRAMQLEVLEVMTQNAETAAQVEIDTINDNFQDVKRVLEEKRDERLLVLQGERDRKEITQNKFERQSLQAERVFASESLKIERDRADAAVAVAETLKNAKIAAAKAALDSQLNAINTAAAADVSGITDEGKKKGLSPGAVAEEIATREKKALADREAAQQKYKQTVADATREATQIQLDGIEQVNQAKGEAAESDRKLNEDQLERLRRIKDLSISVFESVAGAVFTIEKSRLDKTNEEEAKNLEATYNKKKDAAAGNADKLAKIEKQYQKERAELERKAAEDRRKIALKEAIVAGALAVAKALPNPFAAIAAGIAAAAQILIISNQKFAKGGLVKTGTFGGRPHSAGGTKGVFDDGTQIEVEADEDFIILNKRASALRKKYSDLNYATGGNRFAGGGVKDFTPQIAIPNASDSQTIVIQSGFDKDQTEYIAKTLADRIAPATKQAVGEGMDDNRINERRKAELTAQRNA